MNEGIADCQLAILGQERRLAVVSTIRVSGAFRRAVEPIEVSLFHSLTRMVLTPSLKGTKSHSETVETVLEILAILITGLKPGANESEAL